MALLTPSHSSHPHTKLKAASRKMASRRRRPSLAGAATGPGAVVGPCSPSNHSAKFLPSSSVSAFVILLLVLSSASSASAASQNESEAAAAVCAEDAAEGSASASSPSSGSSPAAAPRLNVEPVTRVRDLSVEDFRTLYSPPDRTVPVLFEGLARPRRDDADRDEEEEYDYDPALYTRSGLRKLCGDFSLYTGTDDECKDHRVGREKNQDCHHVRWYEEDLVGEVWAGLDTADLKEWDIETMKDLMDRQDEIGDEDDNNEDEGGEGGGGQKGGGEKSSWRLRRRQGGRGLYLHDSPVVHSCPPMMDVLPGVPKYFRRDYEFLSDDVTLLPIAESDPDFWNVYGLLIHFPSLFVGKGGGKGSPLHTDVSLTRFWKLQLSGRKQWRVVHPRDNARVYPTQPNAPRGSEDAALYAADLFHPDFSKHPLLDGLTVYDVIAEPGDVLYLPEGWPHQVRNLDDSVSVAYNFVDNGNLKDATMVQHRNLAEEGTPEKTDYDAGLWQAFFVPLDDPPPLMVGGGKEEDGGEGEGARREANFVPFRKFFRDQIVRLQTDVPSSVLNMVEECRRNITAQQGGGDAADVSPAALARAVESVRDKYDRPVLHVAASYGHMPVLKYLLDDVGVDPNQRDAFGWTALYVLERVIDSTDGPEYKLLKSRMKGAYVKGGEEESEDEDGGSDDEEKDR